MSIESLIDSITSPNLHEDDYGLLLDLVELVNKNPSTNAIQTLRFLKVKLQSSNANTLLRAITMLDFLAQNCGAMMKANIATPEFVDNTLLPIIDDSIIHTSIKYALVKEIYNLSILFKDDESLSIMASTFKNLQFKVPNLCSDVLNEVNGNKKVSTDPINAAAAAEEEIELKKAIELSLQDSKPVVSMPQQQQSQQSQPQQVQSQQLQPQQQFQPPQPSPSQPSPSQGRQPSISLAEDTSKPDKVVALFDLTSDDEDTLSFKKDDIITIVEEINADWLRGCLNGRAGIIPTNYVKKIPKTIESDISNLIQTLNSSFDIETTLSQLMDLSKKVKTCSMSSQQFESCLLSNSFPNKIQKIEQIKMNMKQILDLQNLKLLELKSIQSNIDNSLKTYQDLITQTAPAPENTEISNFIKTYPDISSLSLNPQMTQGQPPIQPPSIQPPSIQPQFTQQQIPFTSTGSVNNYMRMQQQSQSQPPQQPQQQSSSSNMYNYDR